MWKYFGIALILFLTADISANAEDRTVYDRVIASLDARNGGHKIHMQFVYTNARDYEQFALTYSVEADMPILTMRYAGSITQVMVVQQDNGSGLMLSRTFPRILTVIDRGAKGTHLTVREEFPGMPENIIALSKASDEELVSEYRDNLRLLADFLEAGLQL